MTIKQIILNILRRLLNRLEIPSSVHETRQPRKHKMTRNDVMEYVQKNNGASSLNFINVDLSGVDLGGLELSGAIFGKYFEQNSANLRNTKLSWSNLEYALLANVDFEGSYLYGTNLKHAYLPSANFSSCTLVRANLQGAELYLANFQEANLLSANLKDAYLVFTNFQGAQLEKECIGERLLQENKVTLQQYLENTKPLLPSSVIRRHIDKRYLEAARIYRTLKSCFSGNGNYEDSAWAHIKERQMLRHSHHPANAFSHYREEIPKKHPWRTLKLVNFYIKHAIHWLAHWISELSCGYGEQPIRVVVWSALILIIFPFLYTLSSGIQNTVSDSVVWNDYFFYSLASFSTIGFFDLVAINNTAKFLTSVEALLGISALALLMFALGNRISQR